MYAHRPSDHELFYWGKFGLQFHLSMDVTGAVILLICFNQFTFYVLWDTHGGQDSGYWVAAIPFITSSFAYHNCRHRVLSGMVLPWKKVLLCLALHLVAAGRLGTSGLISGSGRHAAAKDVAGEQSTTHSDISFLTGLSCHRFFLLLSPRIVFQSLEGLEHAGVADHPIIMDTPRTLSQKYQGEILPPPSSVCFRSWSSSAKIDKVSLT
jgi:hypothetical protein